MNLVAEIKKLKTLIQESACETQLSTQDNEITDFFSKQECRTIIFFLSFLYFFRINYFKK